MNAFSISLAGLGLTARDFQDLLVEAGPGHLVTLQQVKNWKSGRTIPPYHIERFLRRLYESVDNAYQEDNLHPLLKPAFRAKQWRQGVV